VLIDLGFSCREVERRLRLAGADPAEVRAVIVTHEHVDHVRGLPVFLRRHPVPVYLTPGTLRALGGLPEERGGARAELISPGREFRVGLFRLLPFSVPHDASEPIGLSISWGGPLVAYATDLGHVSGRVAGHLRQGDVLVLESNHDLEMLRSGPYPWALKQRILGRRGHLSNEALAGFLAEGLAGIPHCLYLAHISEVNNERGLALLTSSLALARAGREGTAVRLTYRDQPSETLELG
jgi:phosphoribosyl 1,2-cyclic phosphodiesterase